MKKIKYILLIIGCLLIARQSNAQANLPYLCEIGVQAGVGYYVGDATPHIFMNPREAYGIHFRYKFTKRWAIQTKVAAQRITGSEYTSRGVELDTKWQNQMLNIDIMAEFNFFRFGAATRYDKRIKPYTPYIFIGLGGGLYKNIAGEGINKITAAGYIPVGIGFKWKFHDRVGLNIAWQHNLYFCDDLEARIPLNNKHNLNGLNWMNCDLTGMFTVGLVIEFAKPPKDCRVCNTD